MNILNHIFSTWYQQLTITLNFSLEPPSSNLLLFNSAMAFNAPAVDVVQGVLNINMINITKLTTTNFMTWNLQVHALLDGYDVAGYLDGSISAPDQMITVDGESIPNP